MDFLTFLSLPKFRHLSHFVLWFVLRAGTCCRPVVPLIQDGRVNTISIETLSFSCYLITVQMLTLSKPWSILKLLHHYVDRSSRDSNRNIVNFPLYSHLIICNTLSQSHWPSKSIQSMRRYFAENKFLYSMHRRSLQCSEFRSWRNCDRYMQEMMSQKPSWHFFRICTGPGTVQWLPW